MSFEIYFNDIPLHPNCLSYTYEIGNEEVTHTVFKCERCNNRKNNTTKILPVNPETFCAECKQQYDLLIYITEE